MITVALPDGRTLPASWYLVDERATGVWMAQVRVLAADGAALRGVRNVALVSGDRRLERGDVVEVTVSGGTASLVITALGLSIDAPTVARQWASPSTAADIALALMADAGAGNSMAEGPALLATWRARGRSLRDEAASLARWSSEGSWYVSDAGALSVIPRTWEPVDAPGPLLGGVGARRYATPDVGLDGTPRGSLPPLVGRTLDGLRVARAVYAAGGAGKVSDVDVYTSLPDPPAAQSGIVGAEVVTQDTGTGRVDVITDTGVPLAGLALWAAPGVRAMVPSGVRVLILDVADDPRDVIALASPNLNVDRLDLADAHAPLLRVGDIVMMPSGAAATPTPTPLTLGPGQNQPGPPGSGHSKVHG